MKIFIFLILVVCSVAAHADTPDPSEQDAQAAQSAESTWQGTWTGSELDTFGKRSSVTAKIKVTNGKVSGTWKVRTQGLKPISGQVDGKEASITILQGGSTIRATLVDQDTVEYTGIRGSGKLSRQ